MLASKAANVKSVVLEWYGREEWTDLLPDYRFANFEQLVEELTTLKLGRRS